MKYEIISERINSAMKNAKISQRKLAAKSNISTMSIRNYQKGLHRPTETTARKLSEVLKVNYKWLMGEDISNSLPGAENPQPKPETIFTLENFLKTVHNTDKEYIICDYDYFKDNTSKDISSISDYILMWFPSFIIGYRSFLTGILLNAGVKKVFFLNDYIIIWVDI